MGDYMSGKSTLCDLRVLIDRLSEYAMHLNEWEPYCKSITDAYFEQGEEVKTDEAVVVTLPILNHHENIWFLVVGIIIGIVVMWMIDRKEFIKNILRFHKYESLR